MSCVREASPPLPDDQLRHDIKKRRFLQPWRGLRRIFRRKGRPVMSTASDSSVDAAVGFHSKGHYDMCDPSAENTTNLEPAKSHSTSQLTDDQIDNSQRKSLTTTLSVSHDSVFTSEQRSPDSGSETSLGPIPRLPFPPHSSVRNELIEVIRQRRLQENGSDDEDLGLPRSPVSNSPTAADHILSKENMVTKSSQSTCSDKSLLSMESSEMDEESYCQSSRHSSKHSLYEKWTSTCSDSQHNDRSSSSLNGDASSLSHSAAKHKMAVKPKRNHGAPHKKRQLKSSNTLPTTPEVNEDSGSRTLPPSVATSTPTVATTKEKPVAESRHSDEHHLPSKTPRSTEHHLHPHTSVTQLNGSPSSVQSKRSCSPRKISLSPVLSFRSSKSKSPATSVLSASGSSAIYDDVAADDERDASTKRDDSGGSSGSFLSRLLLLRRSSKKKKNAADEAEPVAELADCSSEYDDVTNGGPAAEPAAKACAEDELAEVPEPQRQKVPPRYHQSQAFISGSLTAAALRNSSMFRQRIEPLNLSAVAEPHLSRTRISYSSTVPVNMSSDSGGPVSCSGSHAVAAGPTTSGAYNSSSASSSTAGAIYGSSNVSSTSTGCVYSSSAISSPPSSAAYSSSTASSSSAVSAVYSPSITSSSPTSAVYGSSTVCAGGTTIVGLRERVSIQKSLSFRCAEPSNKLPHSCIGDPSPSLPANVGLAGAEMHEYDDVADAVEADLTGFGHDERLSCSDESTYEAVNLQVETMTKKEVSDVSVCTNITVLNTLNINVNENADSGTNAGDVGDVPIKPAQTPDIKVPVPAPRTSLLNKTPSLNHSDEIVKLQQSPPLQPPPHLADDCINVTVTEIEDGQKSIISISGRPSLSSELEAEVVASTGCDVTSSGCEADIDDDDDAEDEENQSGPTAPAVVDEFDDVFEPVTESTHIEDIPATLAAPTVPLSIAINGQSDATPRASSLTSPTTIPKSEGSLQMAEYYTSIVPSAVAPPIVPDSKPPIVAAKPCEKTHLRSIGNRMELNVTPPSPLSKPTIVCDSASGTMKVNDTVVVMRRRSRDLNQQVRDEEPELMKVFARRSLKLKEPDDSGATSSEELECSLLSHKSRDSDKENEDANGCLPDERWSKDKSPDVVVAARPFLKFQRSVSHDVVAPAVTSASDKRQRCKSTPDDQRCKLSSDEFRTNDTPAAPPTTPVPAITHVPEPSFINESSRNEVVAAEERVAAAAPFKRIQQRREEWEKRVQQAMKIHGVK